LAVTQYAFNITQRPGEDGEALARRIEVILRRLDAQRRRAALGDWA